MGADDSYIDVLGCRGDISYSGNAGVWMERTDQMLARVDTVIAMNPSTVVVLGGTNDIIQHTTDTTIDNLEHIRARLEAAGIRVVVGLLPPSEKFPDEVADLNNRISAWAEGVDVSVFDGHAPLADDDGTYRDGMSEDGLHPSREGTEILADVAARAVAD